MKTLAVAIPPLIACAVYLTAFIHALREGNQ